MSEKIPIDDVPDESWAIDDDDAALNERRARTAAVARLAPPAEDLSAELVLALERRPGEQVTCRRVGGRHYRCNWWTAQDTAGYDNPGMRGALVTTSRIARSEYLFVTRADGADGAGDAGCRLSIRVDTRPARPRGFWFGA